MVHAQLNMCSDEPFYNRFNLFQVFLYLFPSLQFAVDLARMLQHPAPSEWQQIADKLKIPYDTELKYHPEFDGYEKGELLSVFGFQIAIASLEFRFVCLLFILSVFTGSDVKQADVILIGFPLGLPMSPEVRRNDLEFYEAVTDPLGPAMTWVKMS